MKKSFSLIIILGIILCILMTLFSCSRSDERILKQIGFKEHKEKAMDGLFSEIAGIFNEGFENKVTLNGTEFTAGEKILVSGNAGKDKKSVEVIFSGYYPFLDEVYVRTLESKKDKVFKIKAKDISISKTWN